ncbi:Crossover junction endonuclease mus81 [Exophiala dermatitidis]|uniref:Crossover junction endonuclease MUS81 n=1 Tax=Exophiala dermatitidis TaxID=5970 RepID=A0AAN6J3B2_EXODE|nr:Crossover junction endonuclease mus81 [Exophiala dermatitidis]KAJ4528195.1 Crossover junction endonuclease mus81 [Exophiala dermatitidis]KAJ4528828.1 Crossover junction endonuclease mus81 [Exophiala dermatitidis]KAJ4530217.1 Crossover junction endonuclease mus81 [Exophiala dermatitidis]KAJ4553155.1 Crossover junction endonuclease mus81 [Exophiala dermatitidis]
MPEDCANPRLAEWLKEWMDEAKERNSKAYTVYKKAYESMKACPLRFDHPSEAQQLNGLGPKLCDRLTDKLKVFCDQNGIPMPPKRGKKRKSTDPALAGAEGGPETAPESPVRRVRKSQPYVPKMRSGAYALILALATLDRETNAAIAKNELMALAQPHCDSSFYAPSDPTKYYTAWKSMQTLENKELVCTKGHPTKRYYLSDEGWEVAIRMRATLEGRTLPQPSPRGKNKAPVREPAIPRDALIEPVSKRNTPVLEPTHTRPTSQRQSVVVDLSSDDDPDWPVPEPEIPAPAVKNNHTGSRLLNAQPSSEDTILLPQGSFEVRMVLDMREVRTTTDRDYISAELKKYDVVPVLRALPLGDVLWVAQVKPPYGETLKAANAGDDEEGNQEIVLEHILERKRLDDLIGSIKDGRFHEQKFRLHKSGIKNVTYLVEEYSLSAERSEKYGDALESALASMQVVNNFFVKQTSKLDDSIRYLARMTKTLKALYERNDIHVVPSRRFEAEAVAITLDRLRRVSPGKTYGITFSAFGAMCDKSESMTLRDVYLKMLMCTRGVTGEKAIEIQKIWPTPRALAEAFEARKTGPEKDNMISERLGNAIPRKKVAKQLSAKIAEIWG